MLCHVHGNSLSRLHTFLLKKTLVTWLIYLTNQPLVANPSMNTQLVSSFNKLLVWSVPLAQVLRCPQLILPSKTWFLKLYWIFCSRNHFKINISHILNCQINSIKSCPSRSFQEHQRCIPIPPQFSAPI